MPYLIGIVLSVGVALFARCVEFDRDRAFYPTVLMVIASYYVAIRGDERLGSYGHRGVGRDDHVRARGRCRIQVERMDRRCFAGEPWHL